MKPWIAALPIVPIVAIAIEVLGPRGDDYGIASLIGAGAGVYGVSWFIAHVATRRHGGAGKVVGCYAVAAAAFAIGLINSQT